MKKKLVLLLALCFILSTVMLMNHVDAAPSAGGRGRGVSYKLFTLQDGCFAMDALATASTTPDNAERTVAIFEADPCNITFDIKSGWNAIRLRLSSTTDGDDTVTDVFLSNGLHYNRIATLTWVTGTQTATVSGHEYADTVAESNANWHKTASTKSPTGNYIAEWAVDVLGSSKIGITGTTVDNAATIEITGS